MKEKNKFAAGRPLPASFYLEADVTLVARKLLGKFLVTNFDGIRTAGMIVETEAYAGAVDRASHAFGNRRTKRTEVMYAKGGVAYVYLCYGMHCLTNVVTHAEGIPHAVLIRALEPAEGIEAMLKRTGRTTVDYRLTGGPGVLSKALGLSTRHTGMPFGGSDISLENRGIKIGPKKIIASARVGVGYAGEDALKPWRYRIKGNPWTSPAR